MGFNFSEEEIDSAFRIYQQALEAVHAKTKGTVENLVQWASKVRYEPAKKLSMVAVEFYNDALKRAEEKALEDWQDSDASFTRIIEKIHAGDAAKDRSRQLERVIYEEIQSWQSIDGSGLSSINTTNFKIDSSDFEEAKEILNKFTSDLDDIRSDRERTLNSKREENDIFGCIFPVVIQSVTIVSEGFKAGVQESFNVLAVEFNEKEQEAKNLTDAYSSQATSKSQSFISEGASDLMSKVKNMLD